MQRWLAERDREKYENWQTKRDRYRQLLEEARNEQSRRRKTRSASFNLKQTTNKNQKRLSQQVVALFKDEDEVYDFLDSLNETEMRIILENYDKPDVVLTIKEKVMNDIENTCKDLEIDG